MPYPKNWQRYIALLKASGTSPDPYLAKFAARYRLASSLEDLTLKGFSVATKRGYLVVTRLAYAYTALEALEKALGVFNSDPRQPIVDFRIANQIAKGHFDATLAEIVEAAEPNRRPVLERRVAEMVSDPDSGNVRVLVEGIRNSLFHGKFTPSGSGLSKGKSRPDLLNKLADEILHTADDHFNHWLHGQNSPS